MHRYIGLILFICIVSLNAVFCSRRGLPFYSTSFAYWAAGLELPNIKSSYPSDGLYSAINVADSVPKDREFVVLSQVYYDSYIKDIVYRLRDYYPYYYKPKNLSHKTHGVLCNDLDVEKLNLFERCLEKNNLEFSVVSVTPCSELIYGLMDSNNDCLNCYIAETINEKQINSSNYYNLFSGSDLLSYESGSPKSRCSNDVDSIKYLYEGSTGFLILMKQPIKYIGGSDVSFDNLGISKLVRKEIVHGSHDGLLKVIDSSMLNVKSYLEFSYNQIKVLAVYFPFDWNLNKKESSQYNVIKSILNDSTKDRYDMIMGTLNSDTNYQPDSYNYLSALGYVSSVILYNPEYGDVNLDWGVQYPTKDVTYCWNNLFPRCKNKNYYSRSFLDIDKLLFNFNKGNKSSLNRKCNYIVTKPTRSSFSIVPYNGSYHDKYTQKSRHSGFLSEIKYRSYDC